MEQSAIQQVENDVDLWSREREANKTVDYNELLNMVTDFGKAFQENGAEIKRVEESINAILTAYKVKNSEVFAISNCLFISLTTPDGDTKTKLCRVQSRGTNVELFEQYSSLCQKLCSNPSSLLEANTALREIRTSAKSFSFLAQMMGYYICTFGSCLFFGGSLLDALVAGVCGISIGLGIAFLSVYRTNLFLKTLLAAFVSALLAKIFVAVGFGHRADYITIGALMALAPGIFFTNCIRDIMVGDMVSGLMKISETLVIGSAIAIGTGIAMAIL